MEVFVGSSKDSHVKANLDLAVNSSTGICDVHENYCLFFRRYLYIFVHLCTCLYKIMR